MLSIHITIWGNPKRLSVGKVHPQYTAMLKVAIVVRLRVQGRLAKTCSPLNLLQF